ncbi:TonB-dependent siderophore receptor [Phytohalomonas tamaricis]|uniref:TonB-dependent siderophore receptor n=1 Tax=Phytohalomonas tamaricis TaxID=2081032 RepID=UPI0021D3FDF8|nr:TonB-dependent siderophore receptor [Phytohalomonas tamaricis]
MTVASRFTPVSLQKCALRLTPRNVTASLLALMPTLICVQNASADAGTTTANTMVVVSDRLSTVAPHSYRAKQSTVASKRPVNFLDEAHTVDTVASQVMADNDADSLTEAMIFATGVTQGNTMGGTEDGFIKRGFGSNTDGSILIDGIRQSRGTYSMATIERVEVLKGPASLFHGQQEPGGVINLVTKRPQYQWQRSIEGEVSSFGGGNANLDITGPIADSDFAFRFILHHEDKDYWRNFGSQRRTIVAPSLRWEGKNSRAQLSYEYRDYDLPLDRGTVIVNGKPADIPRTRRLDESWSHIWGHDQAVTAWWEQDLSPDWSVKLTYGWNRRQYSDGQPRVMSVDESTGALTRRADANLGYDRRVQYTSLDTIGAVTLGGMRHDLVIGLDHERRHDYLADVYRSSTVSDANIYDMNYGDLTLDSDSLDNTRSNRLDEINTTGLYANDRWHVGENWIVGVGGRYTHFEQSSGQGRPYVADPDSEESIFLPSLSLLYRLTAATSLYANYSESFVPNGVDSDSGQSLDPEHGKGSEIGLKHLWNDQFALSMALFRIRKDNVAISDNGVTRTVGKAGSQGLELNLSGQLSDQLTMLASYAYTDTEVLKDTADTEGNRLPNAARHTASLYLARDLAITPSFGTWRLGGGVRYVGEREGDSSNSFSLDAYTVADAFIGLDTHWIGKTTHLQLNVKNLFDTTYYPSSGGSTRVVVGDPLEVTMTAKVAF